MADITWTTETRRLADLVPWPRNPRQIREAQAKRLAESFDTFGQVETIAIGPGNEVYNGHQRLNVLTAQHGPDYEVAVRVSSRALTEKEREKLTVFLHQGATGEWDFDLLANEFDLDDLLEWGFDEYKLMSIPVMDSAGNLAGGNYGDAASGTNVPVNVLGVGGLVDRELMQEVKDRLLAEGAIEGGENGIYLAAIYRAYLES